MEQIVRDISDNTKQRLTAQRNWVQNHFDSDSTKNYETIDGKLQLLKTIIEANWIQKNETNKLQCLGVTLGDAITQDLGFNWVEVEDEYGIDPAIKLADTSLLLFPLTMISKRIENDEAVNIHELYDRIKNKVLEIKDKVDKK
jgi:hypothetical protein